MNPGNKCYLYHAIYVHTRLWYAELYRKYTAVYKHNTSVWFALQSHTGEVFVLEAHPTDPRILMSAGAYVVFWWLFHSERKQCYCVCVCVSCRARWFGHTLGHSGRTETEDTTARGA